MIPCFHSTLYQKREVLWSILSGTTEIEVECQSAPSQNIIPKISALTTARSCGDFSFMAQCIRVAPTSRNGYTQERGLSGL